MTLHTWTDGDVLYADDLNKNILGIGKIQQIYTSTGFNCAGGTNTTDTHNVELTAITAASLANADYLIIEVGASVSLDTNSTDVTSSVSLKFEIKETGGSYSTAFDQVLASENDTPDFARVNYTTTKYIHTLTAGQKSNGVQVKITGTGNGPTSSLTNVQTVLYLGA